MGWNSKQSGGLAFDGVREYFFYCPRRESRSAYLVTGGYMDVGGGESVTMGCFHSVDLFVGFACPAFP